jgi:hypothetical protein
MSCTAVVSVFGLTYLGVKAITKLVRDERKLNELLDVEVDALSTDFVTDDGRQEGIRTNSLNNDRSVVVYDAGIALGRVYEAVLGSKKDLDNARGIANLNLTPVDVDQHRVVKRKKRLPYINTVVAECRLTFGVCNRSEANEKAVRRVAVKIMKTHGVRPTHMNAMLPLVVEMVFIPTECDIEARALASSWASRFRTFRYQWLAPKGIRG